GNRPTGVLRTCWISRKSMTASTFSRCSSSSRLARPRYRACSRTLHFILRLRPVIRLSRTLMPRNSAMFWKVRAIPCLAASWGSTARRLRPLNATVPRCGRYTPLMTLSIEDFPAPFGPMIARTSCSRTSNDTPWSATTPPKASETSSTSRTGFPSFLPSLISGAGSRRLARVVSVGLRVQDAQVGGHGADAAVLEAHLRFDEAARLAGIERADERRVLFRDVAPANLASARELAVVGVELLV